MDVMHIVINPMIYGPIQRMNGDLYMLRCSERGHAYVFITKKGGGALVCQVTGVDIVCRARKVMVGPRLL